MEWNAAKIETLPNFTKASSLDEDLTVFTTNMSVFFCEAAFWGEQDTAEIVHTTSLFNSSVAALD